MRGGRPETFAGLAGAGDLVGAVVSKSSHNRRAGELLAQGVPAADIERSIAQAADAVDSVELLANVARDAHLATPALDGLAALVQGRIEPGQWTAAVTEPARPVDRACPRGIAGCTLPCGAGRPSQDQGGARRTLHRAVPRAPARRLLLQLLPRRQPPRRRGPHRADVPAGLPPLRAGAARVKRTAAAAVAHPHRPQPGGQLLPRPLPQARVGDRGRRHDLHAAHDRVAGRGPRAAQVDPRRRPAAARRPARGADHAVRAGHGQPRDRPGAGPHRRRDQGAAAPSDPPARGDRRRDRPPTPTVGGERDELVAPPTSRPSCARR